MDKKNYYNPLTFNQERKTFNCRGTKFSLNKILIDHERRNNLQKLLIGNPITNCNFLKNINDNAPVTRQLYFNPKKLNDKLSAYGDELDYKLLFDFLQRMFGIKAVQTHRQTLNFFNECRDPLGRDVLYRNGGVKDIITYIINGKVRLMKEFDCLDENRSLDENSLGCFYHNMKGNVISVKELYKIVNKMMEKSEELSDHEVDDTIQLIILDINLYIDKIEDYINEVSSYDDIESNDAYDFNRLRMQLEEIRKKYNKYIVSLYTDKIEQFTKTNRIRDPISIILQYTGDAQFDKTDYFAFKRKSRKAKRKSKTKRKSQKAKRKSKSKRKSQKAKRKSKTKRKSRKAKQKSKRKSRKSRRKSKRKSKRKIRRKSR